jgi:hypothetical protein
VSGDRPEAPPPAFQRAPYVLHKAMGHIEFYLVKTLYYPGIDIDLERLMKAGVFLVMGLALLNGCASVKPIPQNSINDIGAKRCRTSKKSTKYQ